MLEAILFFLVASLVLYAILGGADYGAGIVELMSPAHLEDQIEQAVYRAMAPVWEANHMWLILAVVILFNGFPGAYAEISVLLHMPLTLMLICIIIRGCAFTFRHYDAFVDKSTALYSKAFKYSSLLATTLMGMMAGALTKGQFISADQGSYPEVYWLPWTSPFCIAVGVFTCILFAFQATVFLIGEPISIELRRHCRRLAIILQIFAVVCGGIVFFTADYENIPLVELFFTHPVSVFCAAMATILIYPLWRSLRYINQWPARLFLGSQMSCISIGWIAMQYPLLVRYKDGSHLSLIDAAAPPETLYYLLWALGVGSLFIFPALFLLFRVFKSKPRARPHRPRRAAGQPLVDIGHFDHKDPFG